MIYFGESDETTYNINHNFESVYESEKVVLSGGAAAECLCV